MSTDDDIRSAFADHDDEMEGRAASWPAIERGIRRRTRRAAVVAPVAVVALALVIAGAWNVLDDGADVGGFVGPGADGDVGFLLLRDDGALELRDATGKLEREVLPADESVGFRYKLSASRATGMAYFAVLNDPEDCGDRMFSVEIATGELREIGRGRAPAVSPDGRWLAYGSFTGSGATCRTEGIRILDVTTGESELRTLPGSSEGFAYTPNPTVMSWAPDSDELAYDQPSDVGGAAALSLHRTGQGPLAWAGDPEEINGVPASVLFVRHSGAETRIVWRTDTFAYEIVRDTPFAPIDPPYTGYDIDQLGEWVLFSAPNDPNGSAGSVSKRRIADTNDKAIPLISSGSFGEVVWYD